MKRKNVVIDPSEAEAVVSEFSEDQKRYFYDRFDEMKAMINDKFADIDRSVQKTTEKYLKISESVLRIETLIAKKEQLIANKKDLKRGILQATFNIDNVPNVGFGSLCSEKTYRAGANWWLNIRREYSNRKGKQGQSLGARLHHNADSENISYDTHYIVRLLGLSGDIELKKKCRFTSKETGFGWPSFVFWSKLVNFTDGFVDEKGNFKMEVEFSVSGSVNSSAVMDPQFLTCGLVESDCTLLIEGRRFPVNKGLLSAYSNYFKTLFFGRFCEKDQDEIELEEVGAEEFLCLLRVIYPPFNDADVNPNNVGSLLRLADFYQVKVVSDRCLQYLKECAITEVPLPSKIRYAEIYHLSELLDHCLNKCKTVSDFKGLRATGQYSRLDGDIKLQILENVI